MDDINNLIVQLIVINNFNYDIHYTAHGDAFYSKHIFVEKFNFDDEIDKLKEVALLGMNLRPLSSNKYLFEASKLLVDINEQDDKANFIKLIEYVKNTLDNIENIKSESRGVNALLDNIAEKLQQYLGLLNLQVD